MIVTISQVEDLKVVAEHLDRYIEQKKVTVTVTVEGGMATTGLPTVPQGIDNAGGEGGIRTHVPLPDGFRDLIDQKDEVEQ